MNDVPLPPQSDLIEMTQMDHFRLTQVFQSLRGVAALLIETGENDFLPEIKSEWMAAILSSSAMAGEELLNRSKPVDRRSGPR